MTRNNRQYTAIALALIMIFAAGCAGWGADGPADENGEEELDDEQSDVLEDADAEDENGTEQDTDHETEATGEDDDADADDAGAPPADDDSDDEAPADTGDDNGDDAPADDDDSGDDNGDAGDGDDRQDVYNFGLTVPVVDEAGDPVEGETVFIGPPDAESDEYTTDANGEVTIKFWNSDRDDAVMLEVVVDGEMRPAHAVHGGYTMEPFVVGSNGAGEPETHTLTVTVVDENGTVQEADFAVEHTETNLIHTGDNFDGPAEFEIEAGEYHVIAATEAFSDTFVLDGEGMEVVDLTEDTEIVFTGYHDAPGEPGTHTLTVETAAPVHGVDIPIQITSEEDPNFEPLTQNVDENGIATFELPDGEYLVDPVDVCQNASAAVHPVVIDGDDVSESIPGPEWSDPGGEPPADCVNSENDGEALLAVVG